MENLRPPSRFVTLAAAKHGLTPAQLLGYQTTALKVQITLPSGHILNYDLADLEDDAAQEKDTRPVAVVQPKRKQANTRRA